MLLGGVRLSTVEPPLCPTPVGTFCFSFSVRSGPRCLYLTMRVGHMWLDIRVLQPILDQYCTILPILGQNEFEGTFPTPVETFCFSFSVRSGPRRRYWSSRGSPSSRSSS